MSKRQGPPLWMKDLAAGLTAASGVGYVAAAYTVSRWLTRPTRGRPQQTPSDLGLPWEALECTTLDGLRLVGWSATPPRPRATVVLFHGLRHNRGQMLARMTFLAAAGYRCVAFDHRGHGESGGKRTSFGYFEGRDVAAVLDLVRRRWPEQPRAALGLSMGAAALCFAAAETRDLQAVILESLYHDVAEAFRNRIGNSYPSWFKRFSKGVIWVTERRLNVRLTQITPAAHIQSLAPVPVLVLTGSDDLQAPPTDALRLFERCGEPRELIVIPGANHVNVFDTGGDHYQQSVLDFLDRRLFPC